MMHERYNALSCRQIVALVGQLLAHDAREVERNMQSGTRR